MFRFSWASLEVSTSLSPGSAGLLRSKGEIVAHGRQNLEANLNSLNSRIKLSNLRTSSTSSTSQPSQCHTPLQPIFSRHDRSQHSERRALLKVLQRLEEGGAQRDASGSVRLFSCHTPCMSCLNVFAQFCAMYPKIRLTVAFISWPQTYALLQKETKRMCACCSLFEIGLAYSRHSIPVFYIFYDEN